jgi:hypothetical protein
MNDDIKYIRGKLDDIIDIVGQQGITLARNTVTLEEHVRRTNMLEQDIKPLKAHVGLVNAGAKVLSVLMAAAYAARHFGLI